MKKILLVIGLLATFSAYADTSSIHPPVASDVQSPTTCASYAKLMSDALAQTDAGF